MLSVLAAAVLVPAPPPQRVAETIVVTAARTQEPRVQSVGAVSVLTRNELADLPAETLGDALRFIPGLQVISVIPGAPAMVAARGFFGAGEVDYLQLVVDGVPVADAESGVADWRSIPLETIERIEVLRGTGSSLFGDRAIGGVVQVFRRPETMAGVRAGSFGTREMRASGRYGAIRRVDSDGARAHSRFRETVASAIVRHGRIAFSLEALERHREEPGPLSRPELDADWNGSSPLFSGDDERTRRARGSIRHVTPSLEAALFGAVRESEVDRTLLLAPGLGDRAQRTLNTSTIGASVSMARAVTPDLRLVGGAVASRDGLESRYETATAEAAGSGRRNQFAAFGSAEWRFAGPLRLTTGLRWDRTDDRFGMASISEEALTPRIGVNLVLAPGGEPLGVFASISRAFKSPTLDQRFDVRPLPDFQGGTFTISNAALRAQTATAVEAGLVHERPRLSWEVAGYWMTVDDEIDFDLRTFRYANIGRSRHMGVEIAGRFLPSSRISARTAYTWTRAEPLTGDHRGRQLKNIAEHVGRAEVVARLPVAVTLAVERSAGRFADDANHFPLGAATVADLLGQREFGRLRVAGGIRNLFDARSTPLGFTLTGFDGVETPYYYPTPGRTVDLNLTWTVPSKGGPP